jgi:hypothetical protein
LVWSYVFGFDIEDLRGGGCVKIFAGNKGVDKILIFGEFG